MLPAFPGDPIFYFAAIPAVVLLGLSKGGFSGLSTLAMPLFALAISPVKAAAIILPILIVQDWVSVWAFRRDFDLRNLAILVAGGGDRRRGGLADGGAGRRTGGEARGRADLGRLRRLHAAARPPRLRRGDPRDGRARPVLGRDRRLHQLHQPRWRAADDGLHAAAEADAAALRRHLGDPSSPSSTC